MITWKQPAESKQCLHRNPFPKSWKHPQLSATKPDKPNYKHSLVWLSRARMTEWSCAEHLACALSPGLGSPSSAPQLLPLHSSEPPGILSQLMKAKDCRDFASPCTPALLFSISSFINHWVCATLQVKELSNSSRARAGGGGITDLILRAFINLRDF